MTVALIDVGAGNIPSVAQTLRLVGADVVVTDDPAVVLAAEKAVLPGVGAFADCMAGLDARGLRPTIETLRKRGTPLLGICVGMQMFFDESEEHGLHRGMGLLPGRVVRFADAPGRKVPHTGWNQMVATQDNPLLRGVKPDSYVYFNHAYHCVPTEKGAVLATADYGEPVVAAAGRGRLYGVQFHPEKSQHVGQQILGNFVAYG